MPAQIRVIRKAVTSAGTAVQLTSSSTWVLWAEFMAEDSDMYIGDSTVSSTTGRTLSAADEPLVIPPYATDPAQPFDLSEVWVDAHTNGKAIQVTYLEAR